MGMGRRNLRVINTAFINCFLQEKSLGFILSRIQLPLHFLLHL